MGYPLQPRQASFAPGGQAFLNLWRCSCLRNLTVDISPLTFTRSWLVRSSAGFTTNTVGKGWQHERPTAQKRRALITSPLEWQMTAAPVPHPVIPALAERGGTQLQTPRPTLLVDKPEQNPFHFSPFQGWFAGSSGWEGV